MSEAEEKMREFVVLAEELRVSSLARIEADAIRIQNLKIESETLTHGLSLKDRFIESQDARIAELTAELEAARKDAGRLDFMIQTRCLVEHRNRVDGSVFYLHFVDDEENQILDFESPRKAIDGAMIVPSPAPQKG